MTTFFDMFVILIIIFKKRTIVAENRLSRGDMGGGGGKFSPEESNELALNLFDLLAGFIVSSYDIIITNLISVSIDSTRLGLKCRQGPIHPLFLRKHFFWSI